MITRAHLLFPVKCAHARTYANSICACTHVTSLRLHRRKENGEPGGIFVLSNTPKRFPGIWTSNKHCHEIKAGYCVNNVMLWRHELTIRSFIENLIKPGRFESSNYQCFSISVFYAHANTYSFYENCISSQEMQGIESYLKFSSIFWNMTVATNFPAHKMCLICRIVYIFQC